MSFGSGTFPPIGEMAAPPVVRLPDPAVMFRKRSERFRGLASAGSELAPYLRFLAALTDVQGQIDGPVPAVDAVGTQPLDRARVAVDVACSEALAKVIEGMQAVAMPAAARDALMRLALADHAAQRDMLRAVLDEQSPTAAIAEHGFLMAALQTVFARRAAQLDAAQLQPAACVCPVCGSMPVASLIVGWESARGTRYAVCALCGTQWNHVRIKCTLCDSTGGIAYQGIDGDAGLIKAETCESCHRYVKLMQQNREPAIDPMADDVASLGLDLLMRGTEFVRGGANPYLVGY